MEKILNKQTAKVGERYACPWGWIQVTRIIRLTEEEACEACLLYLDRYEGIDNLGHTVSAALPDSNKDDAAKQEINNEEE